MKNPILVGAVILVFASCNNEGGTTDQKLDSLEQKIDTRLEKTADSISAKAKQLKERLEDGWKNRKDSTNSKDSLRKDSIQK